MYRALVLTLVPALVLTPKPLSLPVVDGVLSKFDSWVESYTLDWIEWSFLVESLKLLTIRNQTKDKFMFERLLNKIDENNWK
jgi:hypothetical protein